ncbi:MAG: 1-deoxy-D-xylulose-5-phosphate reductoisomerase [Planctomycetota bacterium]
MTGPGNPVDNPPANSPVKAPADRKVNRVIVLGSTGSIGESTLAVIEHLRRTQTRKIEVVGLAADRSSKVLADQAERFCCNDVALADPDAAADLRRRLPGARLRSGPDAASELVREVEADTVIAAIVGVSGLRSTFEAIQLGRTVALANKEALVAAGSIVMPAARRADATLLPVDSEHAAVAQCLRGEPAHRVRRVILTASGGPFRTASAEVIQNATPEQALVHPTWSMGPKITVDSATMVNKTLEVVEAHHLFGLSAGQLAVLVHPQSVVHAMVEFLDGATVAQLAAPDMKGPIHAALCHPDRPPSCAQPLDWAATPALTFEGPDHHRFPGLNLARRAIEGGGSAGAVLNAANEAAVHAFLQRRIRLGKIVRLIESAMDALPPRPIETLDDVLEADRLARRYVETELTRLVAPVSGAPNETPAASPARLG